MPRATAASALSPGAIFRRMLDYIDETTRDPSRVLRISVQLSAFSIMVSLILSQNVWFQDRRFMLPAPLFEWTSALPPGFNVLLYALMFIGNAILLVAPNNRRAALALVPVFVFLVLQDQVRWQFYLYMNFFNLLVLGLAPKKVKDKHLDPLRFMVIGVYFWGGLYKINHHFADVIFPWFVSPWFPYADVARGVGYAVPFLELAIGIFLLVPRARWAGQALAAAMLVVVIASVGPFGHGGYAFIWPVNIYLDWLAVFLFMDRRRPLLTADAVKKPLAAAAVFLFIALPTLGLTNTLGHHQSFKLFCCTYYEVLLNADGRPVSEKDISKMPENMRIGLGISSYPVVQSSYLRAARGYCQHLDRKDAARLRVVSDPYPFWAAEAEESLYDICAEEPKLISTRKIPVTRVPVGQLR